MKKIVLIAVAACLISIVVTGSKAYAVGIGAKVNYNMMMDDYAPLEDNLSGGVFFDVGNVLFKSLRFRPGLDFVSMETEAGLDLFTVWGVHLDWYWFFLKGSRKLAPYIGFGPALNYYNYDDDSTQGDSDAGFEGFGGIEIGLVNSLALMIEGRLVVHDIADWGTRIIKPTIGIVFYF